MVNYLNTGQRCTGRNYNGRRCCTPEKPCNEGEGDCDGPGDGGLNDGDEGCKGNLVCGSNNCKQFGLYYHDKDDCCEKPADDVINPIIKDEEVDITDITDIIDLRNKLDESTSQI